MTCHLDSNDRKHLVKHYVHRSRRLAGGDAFNEAVEMLTRAQGFVVDDEDHQSIKKTLEDIWLTERWPRFLAQIRTFPLPLKQWEAMRNDIHALAKVKTVDVFIDAAVRAAEDERNQRSFTKAFAILLNIIELTDKRREMCREIQQINRTRQTSFRKAIGSGNEFLNSPLSAFKDAKDCEVQGRAPLRTMQKYMLPDEMLEAISNSCEEKPSYWEKYHNEQQKVSDYEVRLHKKIKHHQLQELWSTPPLLLDRYQRAIEISDKLRHEYPTDDIVRSWWEEAKTHHDEAKAKGQALLFSTQDGDFGPLVSQYRRILKQEKYDLLPWIEKKDGGYVLQEERCVPAKLALAQVEKFARTYADAKASKLLKLSKEQLPTDAVQAQKLIKSAMNLLYLSDEMRAQLKTFRQNEVIPARASQKEADRLIKQAEKKSDRGNHRDSWSSIQAARRKAPKYVDELPETTNKLYRRMRVYWKGLLRSAREFLRKDELDKAAKEARAVLEQTRGVPRFRECFLEAEDLLKVIAFQYEQEEETSQ